MRVELENPVAKANSQVNNSGDNDNDDCGDKNNDEDKDEANVDEVVSKRARESIYLIHRLHNLILTST